jgi:hypothetical protein
MRLVAAILVLAVALPTALAVHDHTATVRQYHSSFAGTDPLAGRTITYQVRPSWDDPVALAITIVGVGTASMLVLTWLVAQLQGPAPLPRVLPPSEEGAS